MDDGPVSGASKVAGREPVEINPEDAKARGIAAGDLVRVFNGRGACLAGAVINEDIRQSVIRLSAGAWYDSDGGAPGALEIHGNPNVLTRDKATSKVGQAPTSTTALVEIEKYEEAAPSINVSRPPGLASA